MAHKSAKQLTETTVSVLDTLRAIGGEARTVQIATAAPKPISLLNLVARLETLERNGLVTSSRTLDGLERVWTIEPRKVG